LRCSRDRKRPTKTTRGDNGNADRPIGEKKKGGERQLIWESSVKGGPQRSGVERDSECRPKGRLFKKVKQHKPKKQGVVLGAVKEKNGENWVTLRRRSQRSLCKSGAKSLLALVRWGVSVTNQEKDQALRISAR